MTFLLFALGIILTAWTMWTAAAMLFLERGWGADMPVAAFVAMVVGSVLLLSGGYWWSRKGSDR